MDSPPIDEKFGMKGSFDPEKHGRDLEGQGQQDRRLSRIGPPIGSLAGLETDSDSGLTVGKQIELECANAIKYRTCSWPKVN